MGHKCKVLYMHENEKHYECHNLHQEMKQYAQEKATLPNTLISKVSLTIELLIKQSMQVIGQIIRLLTEH